MNSTEPLTQHPDIPNLLPKCMFTRKDLPFCINRYYHTNYSELMLHTHDFIEIVYVCDGRGYHIYDGRTYSVAKGDLYIINNHVPHCFYPIDEKNSGHLVVYNCMFLPEFIGNINIPIKLLTELTDIMLYKSLYPEEIVYSPDLKLAGEKRSTVENLYERMYLEYQSAGPDYAEILKLLLCELLLLIHRYHKEESMETGTPAARHKHQLILDCIDYLKVNYSNKITVDELSNYVFLSKSYLSSLFKQVTGSNIVDYLKHIRIEHACRLLIETDLSITEILNSVGYSDYRFFNKSFKKITGMTANEYRKQNTGVKAASPCNQQSGNDTASRTVNLTDNQ